LIGKQKPKKMETGKLIKELRIKKGLTQEELADMTEVSARTIQRIENGEVDPRSYTLQMISKALDVDISLFTETNSKENIEYRKESERTWLALIHLSGLFFLIFPCVLIWNKKKNEIEGITDHYRDIINYQLSIWLIFMMPGIIAFLFAGVPYPIFVAIIFNVMFTIPNSIKVLNGRPYKYFYAYKFQKSKNSM
jgi:transcriptional regulator with XRE-family HTH domain